MADTPSKPMAEPLGSLDESGALACLLDLVPGAAAAFGLRLLRAAFGREEEGKIIGLQRADDLQCEYFGALADGALDLPAIARLLDGSRASCAAWYDQSGHRNHAESIEALPAFELMADATRPTLGFQPPAQFRSPLSLAGLEAVSIFAVFRAPTVADCRSVARWQGAGDCVVFPYHTGNAIISADGGVGGGVPLELTPGAFSVHGLVWKRNAADGFTTYRDGQIIAQRGSSDTGIGLGGEPLFIGSYAGMAEHFVGELRELVIWPRALSADEIRLVSHDMQQTFDPRERIAFANQPPAELTTLAVGEVNVDELIEQAIRRIYSEFTVMPRYGYHQPLDYERTTLPPDFEAPIFYRDEPLPLPPVRERMGYAADDDFYLEWGRYDRDLVIARIEVHSPGPKHGATILDFGCSSGRVLRHFHREHEQFGWRLLGVDIQARPIEWMRQHFPSYFEVVVGTVLPHLPYEDNSIDYIYGFSVFTHIKFLWDNWLLELRRILKPGGLLLQTFHAEAAWKFYHQHRNEEIFQHLPEETRQSPEMNVPFLYHGDIASSQIFWQRETARQYWGRYLDVLAIYDPSAKHSFQDMIVCKKKIVRSRT